MNVKFKTGRENSSKEALILLRQNHEHVFESVSQAIRLLEQVENLSDVKQFYLNDMELTGHSFSIVFKVNFQFVISGLLGEQQTKDLIEIELCYYE